MMMVLPRRRGGAELISNGTFVDGTGWGNRLAITDGSITYDNKAIVVNNSHNQYQGPEQLVTTFVPGVLYRVTAIFESVDCTVVYIGGGSTGGSNNQINSGNVTITAGGLLTYTFTFTPTITSIYCSCAIAGFNGALGNVLSFSIKPD